MVGEQLVGHIAAGGKPAGALNGDPQKAVGEPAVGVGLAQTEAELLGGDVGHDADVVLLRHRRRPPGPGF